MAAIDEDEAQDIVNRSVILINEFEKYAAENLYAAGPHSDKSKLNFVDHAELLLIATRLAGAGQTIGGEEHGELELGVQSAVASFRSSLSSVRGQAAALLAPSIQILGRFYGFNETSPTDIIDRIFEYFLQTGRRVRSRGLSVASAADARVDGASMSTKGSVYTKSTMHTGDPIDNLWPETIALTCIADEHTGATEHRELFSIEGEPVQTDGLSVTGSGSYATINALGGADSLALNSSFTSFTGTTTVPTGITNWTHASGADPITTIDIDTTTYYRDSSGEATPAALKFVANEKLTQAFEVRNIQFNEDVPYFFHLAYKASSTATGNISVTIGGNSANTVAFNGGSSTAWQVLSGSLFFRNFNEETPDIEIEVSSLAGSGSPTLHVDDFIFAPMQSFNGLFLAVVGKGGTGSPFLREDRFTIAITQPAITARVGIVNEWLWKAYNKYLPCEASPNGSATPPDWIDPTDYS